jgi:hypothetical protein
MTSRIFKSSRRALLAAAALGTLARAQDTAEPESEFAWYRSFRIGGSAMFGVRADFRLAGAFPVSGAQPGDLTGSAQNRTYDDGFVRVDSTGNARGLTSNWGYQRADQIVGDRLRLSGTTSFTGGGAARVEPGPQLGFDLAYGGRLGAWRSLRYGWEFGFGLTPMDVRDSSTLGVQVNQVRDEFALGGIVPPQAPYTGGSSGLGPLIGSVPVSRTEVSAVGGTITGTRQIDAWLYNFRLGPTAYWDLHPRWSVEAGAGVALGLLTGSYRYDEFVGLTGTQGTRNTGRIRKTDLQFGAYVGATVFFHLLDNADLFAGMQFQTLGDFRFADAGREANLRMGTTYQALLGVSWPF